MIIFYIIYYIYIYWSKLKWISNSLSMIKISYYFLNIYLNKNYLINKYSLKKTLYFHYKNNTTNKIIYLFKNNKIFLISSILCFIHYKLFK